MLREAKAAGEELLWVKKYLKHGEFKPWIEKNCAFGYVTATHYMKVAKKFTVVNFSAEELSVVSIREFLGRTEKTKATLQSFSQRTS